ncbi:hypothetical protein [Synechococcus sp. MIT S1220]|uniref:hypothetical protein n=1 Tax=Synechococcus sp. MIT S1220 TaxID=3082549 RepID=UPI0039AF83C5
MAVVVNAIAVVLAGHTDAGACLEHRIHNPEVDHPVFNRLVLHARALELVGSNPTLSLSGISEWQLRYSPP